MPPTLWLWGGLAAALGGVLTWQTGQWFRSKKARDRNTRARAAESDAERCLAAKGYEVVGRQVSGRLDYFVDGVAAHASVRCDLLVQRGMSRWVAEVKSGQLAPSLSHGPTRRQLLEYAIAFKADGLLLVEPARNRVVAVRFPGRSGPFLGFFVGCTVGALVLGALTIPITWPEQNAKLRIIYLEWCEFIGFNEGREQGH